MTHRIRTTRQATTLRAVANQLIRDHRRRKFEDWFAGWTQNRWTADELSFTDRMAQQQERAREAKQSGTKENDRGV